MRSFLKSLLIVSSLYNELYGTKVYLTAYTATRSQTDNSPCISADGTNICRLYRKGVCVVAVSRDLRKNFPYGSKVFVGDKVCYVHDTMNKRWRKRVDMFLGQGRKAYRKMLKWDNHYTTIRLYKHKVPKEAKKGTPKKVYSNIKLPKNVQTVTVKRGDTAISIAKKYNMTLFQLSLYNHRWFKTQSLPLGFKLIVLTNEPKQVKVAKSYMGVKYKWGGESYKGIDCSGLTLKSYEAMGITLPRTSNEQYHYTKPVSRGNWKTGDLVFFRARHAFAGHVGILLDPQKKTFIQASSSRKRGHKVTISSFANGEYKRRFLGVRRVPEQH